MIRSAKVRKKVKSEKLIVKNYLFFVAFFRFKQKKHYFCSMNSSFTPQLEQWYAVFGRDLPWRHTSDPYLILLSEFILQQTQISQGMDYYLRFVKRFPTVESLAEAREEEVLRLWQGLGYYSRARHLHASAKQIAEAGSFPRDYSFVRALPGVGDYTAAAVMSFAFGEQYAVIDGNVQRVLTRYFGISEPIDTTQGKKLLRALADEMLDRQHPALYNQAIMDFGALQCKPSAPVCETCPLAETCQALRNHLVDKLPVKAKRTAVRDRYLTYIYTRTKDGQTLLHRRGSGDIWQGLFEFPMIESEKPLTMEEVEQRIRILQPLAPERNEESSIKGEKINYQLSIVNYQLQLVARDVCHQLTHQRLHADFYCLTLPNVNFQLSLPPEEGNNNQLSINNYQLIKETDLDNYPLPRLLEKLLEIIRLSLA